MTRRNLLYTIFWSLLLAVIPLTIYFGEIPWSIVWDGAIERIFKNSVKWNPLMDERLPRLIVLFASGASLAAAGACMQALFLNPLASPGVLGTSGGASLMVTLALIFGLHLSYPFAIPIAAFLGCMATLLFVYFLSRKNHSVEMTTLILTGVAISTTLMAAQAALAFALRDRWELIQTMTEWQAASTWDRSWKHVHMQLPLTLIGLAVLWRYRPEINFLSFGEEDAKNLGVDVKRVRWRLFLSVSLLTAGSIASIGMLPFFGLVLPHIIRQICGPDHRNLIPLCILGGAATLAGVDLFLRYFHLHMLSLGNLSALFGGIFFLFLLCRRKRQTREMCS